MALQENPMREIRIEKVTLNIGCGDDKQKIERAQRLLTMLTGKRPVVTHSKRRSTFGVTKGKPIGTKVTLRKNQAEDFFKLVLQGVENKLRANQLDKDGNVNIGINEYIDLPGVKYSHDVGLMGLGVAISLERKGYSIKRRRVQKRIIPKKHKINKDEVIKWLKEKYGVEIV
jgi:large subunit ribosomal protein L5